MKTPERYVDPRLTDFAEMANRANALYKQSRSEAGKNDLKSRFLSESSAWFGERAFVLANESGFADFVCNVIARDAVIAYFNAGLPIEVLRFGNFAKERIGSPVFAKSIEPYLNTSICNLPPGVSRVVASTGIKHTLSSTLL